MSDSSDPVPLPRPSAEQEHTSWFARLRPLTADLRLLRPDLSWAVIGFVAAIVIGVLVWSRVGATSPAPIEESLPTLAPATIPTPSSTPSSSSQGTVVVHVAGAVARPGVYELPEVARVAEAIEAAGGATGEADLDRVNLAAILTDASQVFVPRPGEAAPMSAARPEVGDGGAVTTVDLNTATLSDLETLPGVGPVTAAAIIAHREENGPFATVSGLDEVSGIGPARLEQLRSLVTVGGTS